MSQTPLTSSRESVMFFLSLSVSSSTHPWSVSQTSHCGSFLGMMPSSMIYLFHRCCFPIMEISMTVLWFPWHIKVQLQQLRMLWQRTHLLKAFDCTLHNLFMICIWDSDKRKSLHIIFISFLCYAQLCLSFWVGKVLKFWQRSTV